jgi:hypothetical protein
MRMVFMIWSTSEVGMLVYMFFMSKEAMFTLSS